MHCKLCIVKPFLNLFLVQVPQVYNVSTMFKNLNVISSENNPLENAPYAS